MGHAEVEVHERECRPEGCAPSCVHYRAPDPEREPDLIDNCADCAKLIFELASAPEEPKSDEASKAGGFLTTALRLLGVGK